MGKFKEHCRDQAFLLPPSLHDWLPESHLARFVVEVVETLNLQALCASYSGKGAVAYPPDMMVALLFYGYATGVFSSRKLERSTYDSVAFRFIAANMHPDHDTIADFRKRFLPQLQHFFVRILEIAHDMSMLKLGTICLDGTKIKANASKHRALSYAHAEKLEKQLQEEVRKLLEKAEAVDAEDMPDGMSLPEELARRESRLQKIWEAKAEIERRAQVRHSLEKQDYEAKLQHREAKTKATGKKPGGKPPLPPTPGPAPKDQVNLTDGDSRIMPVSGGAFEQTYNAQASVDAESMLIVTEYVTQATVDKEQVAPTLCLLTDLPDSLGQVEHLVADNGYYSAKNIELCEKSRVIPLFAQGRERHNPNPFDRFSEPAPLPTGATATARHGYRLKTKAGRAIYGLRKQVVEPVFGIIKSVLGFRQFLLRGISSVQGEWSLVCLAYNLKRMHQMTING